MKDFQDLRKYARKSFTVEMLIDSLYKQDYDVIDNVNADIKILNISHGGIGFFSEKDLPIDYYFNAHITFNKEHHFKAVLKIIRKLSEKSGFNYGCQFVGLAETLASMIDRYNAEE